MKVLALKDVHSLLSFNKDNYFRFFIFALLQSNFKNFNFNTIIQISHIHQIFSRIVSTLLYNFIHKYDFPFVD